MYFDVPRFVFMIISVLLGVFQYAVSRLMKENQYKDNYVAEAQTRVLRLWGQRSLIFSLILAPFYFLKENFTIFIITYIVLSFININNMSKNIKKISIKK